MGIDFSKSKIIKTPKIKKARNIKQDEAKESKGVGIGVADFPKICFGDFLDDLFKKKIAFSEVDDRYVPIIDYKIPKVTVREEICNLILDEWMEDLKVSTNYFTYLRNGNSKDYEIGNKAISGFLNSPNETKRKLINKIDSFIYGSDVTFNEKAFRSYILSIIALKFPDELYTYIKNQHIEDGDTEEKATASAIIIKGRYENRLNDFIGGNEEQEIIIESIINLLDFSQYSEVLALFVLAFVILQKYRYTADYNEQDRKDIRKMIWFDFKETNVNKDSSPYIVSQFLKDYELTDQIEEIPLTGDFYKQECCVVNGKIDKFRALDKYVNGYKTVSLADYTEVITAISTAMNGYKVKFLLFGKDNNGNLEDCINLLDILHKCRFSNDYERKMLIENIDIYVCADFDYASTLIDSAINTNKDAYYRVHICDYNKMAAQKLLIEAPVFLPNLADDSDVNIVILGINDGTLRLTEEIIASTFMKKIPKISVVGNNADFYKQKIKQKLPGVYKTESSIKRIVPEFIECDIESASFLELLSNDFSAKEDLKLSDTLKKGTYFIVDIGDDRDNILFAKNLRAWMLSCDENFSRTPFIAVKCEDDRNANIARHLVVHNKESGNDYFNNYNLFFYGMKDSVYSFEYIDIGSNRQKQIALNIHLFYYGDNINEKDKADAIESYFRFSYNRDSSECASNSIVYMLYSLGMIKTLDDLKCNEQLSKKYEHWVQERDNKEAAARYENSRWIGFMLARGWRAASLGQVRAYSGQESGNDHKHTLCKLHPFICNWDNFDNESENLKFDALKAVNKNLQSPKASTYNIVSSIGKILTKNPFAKNESNTDKSR